MAGADAEVEAINSGAAPLGALAAAARGAPCPNNGPPYASPEGTVYGSAHEGRREGRLKRHDTTGTTGQGESGGSARGEG